MRALSILLIIGLAPSLLSSQVCTSVDRNSVTKAQLEDIRKIMEKVEKRYKKPIKNKKKKQISIYQAAVKYNLNVRHLAAIIAVESAFKLRAVNKKSNDYGIAQINYKNIAARKLDKARLLQDLDYSVAAGAKILAEKQKRYEHKESLWYCRYNVGTGAYRKIEKGCKKYANRVNYYLISEVR